MSEDKVNTECSFLGTEPLGFCHTHRRYDCSVFREIDHLREELAVQSLAVQLSCEMLWDGATVPTVTALPEHYAEYFRDLARKQIAASLKVVVTR